MTRQHQNKGKVQQSHTTESDAHAATASSRPPKVSVRKEEKPSAAPAPKAPEHHTQGSPLRRGIELIVAVLLATCILCLLGTWGSALFANLFFSGVPSALAGVHIVSLSPSNGPAGVSTEPPGSRIASTSATAHATLIFTLEQVESVTPTRGSMTGYSISSFHPKYLPLSVMRQAWLQRENKLESANFSLQSKDHLYQSRYYAILQLNRNHCDML